MRLYDENMRELCRCWGWRRDQQTQRTAARIASADKEVTMFDRADSIASYGLVVAGITHAALTLQFHPAGGEGALWFAGSGLALIVGGLLNLARRATPNRRVRRLSGAGNLVSLLYMLLVTRMLPAPHVLLILGMQLVVTICSVDQ